LLHRTFVGCCRSVSGHCDKSKEKGRPFPGALSRPCSPLMGRLPAIARLIFAVLPARCRIHLGLSFPKIPSGLGSRREVESSHDWGRCLKSCTHSECSSSTCSSRDVHEILQGRRAANQIRVAINLKTASALGICRSSSQTSLNSWSQNRDGTRLGRAAWPVCGRQRADRVKEGAMPGSECCVRRRQRRTRSVHS
jgi:hypothetical protein